MPITVEREEGRQSGDSERFEALLVDWKRNPVHFVCEVLDAQPDPWQCDVMDALLEEDSVAIRACHGVGKTALLSWVILWYTFTHKNAVVPTTAPTYNKQVRDILWGTGVHKWYEQARNASPWLAGFFELTQTRLQHAQFPATWFAVGIASGQPINVEGYHADNLLAVFDEAKGISKSTWESIHGMRTTQEAKFLVASTPGGKIGEFFKVFTEYRSTWPSLFVIRPDCLRETLREPESQPYSRGGVYYSQRVREKWVRERGLEWGTDSAAYKARCVGDFPDLADMNLIPHEWLMRAKTRTIGTEGETWISCDVARSGRDRTVILAGRGGTLLAAETVSRTAEGTTAVEARVAGIGKDAKRPFYRSTIVTGEICRRMRLEHGADGIIIDDGTFGGGVTDYLKAVGERVVPISFGGSPTDRPKDPEERKRRQEKHLVDSNYINIKAEMGWALRGAFESNSIALALLPPHIMDPLIEQCSLVEVDVDAAGRMKLIDPDEQEELPGVGEEVRRSPDHFHALILLWWATGTRQGKIRPKSGSPGVSSLITHLGVPPDKVGVGGQAGQIQSSPRISGQAAWVRTRYSGR